MTVNYGARTSAEILDEMKAGVRDDVDKREGSVVHDMLAPPAEEIEMLGWELDAIYQNGFADTADLDYLKRRAAEMGVNWKDAVTSQGAITLTGAEGVIVPAGYRVFTGADVFFQTTADATLIDGTASVSAQAVEGGLSGNVGPGEITQFEATVAGITAVTNNTIFTGGVDEETSTDLLARYLLKVRKPITSGNVYHYEKWATDVDGISTAKVFPIWNGNGTVKVVVIATNGRAPAPDIVANVAAYIETVRPIGASVTVVPVNEIAVDISVILTLAGDLLVTDVLDAVKTSIGDYLLSEADSGLIRYTRVGESLLDVTGVVDYEGLSVNGGTLNIPISEDAVAVVGEVLLG